MLRQWIGIKYLVQHKYNVAFFLAFLGYVVLDLVSWFSWSHLWLTNIAALAITLIWCLVAWRSLSAGVILLLVELIIGSQGYLLSLKVGTLVLSLRLLLFLSAFALLAWRLLVNRRLELFSNKLSWWYLAALASLAWGTIVAFWRGNEFANIFLDVNGLLYLFLWPLYIEAFKEKDWYKWWRILVYPALLWLSLKTIIALYLFSHIETGALLFFYKWWRQTGFGEITYVSGNFFRIFSQSQVFSSLAVVGGLFYLCSYSKTTSLLKNKLAVMGFIWFNLVTLLASLSRSFWLGSIVSIILFFLINLKFIPWRVWFKTFLLSLLLFGSALGFILFTIQSEWPLQPLGAGMARIFSERLSEGEAASASRLKLLSPLWQSVHKHYLVGSGFGTTVTYYSADPRLIRSSAGGTGLTTTYAFEWGYLDLWLKLGLVGLLGYMGFIFVGWFKMLQGWWKTKTPTVLWVFPMLALFIINITTPYLNHPLGLGAVMLFLAWPNKDSLLPEHKP